jgi:N-acetylneuraminate lyase
MSSQGLVAAAFTPMGPSGDLDLGVVPRLVEHLVNEGVTGLFCNGSTGEGESLTPEERRAVAAAFVRASGGRLRVYVQVGANSLRVARDLAAHAAEIGADAIAATPPGYFKPRTAGDVVGCLEEIASAAPSLPLVFYHFPSMTGVDVDVVELMQVAGEAIPTFSGAKLSEPDPALFQACARLHGGRFDVFWGRDETLLSGLAAGATTAIGATYCFAGAPFRSLMAAYQAGDLETARAWQARCARMVGVQVRRGGFPAFKATMALIGVECGPVRLPQRALPPEEIEAMRAELEAIGYFEWGRP